ncbi:hypothetical protein BJV78DRAFT_1152022 [Lactifluus subvellereus]|nr:hypothetical protein BJV78DRAFT_1152022 [Lactifluus subvellereus]
MDPERTRYPSWDPFDPNVLSVVDPDSPLGRDLAISLQGSALEDAENSDNPSPLTDECPESALRQIETIAEKLPRLTESDLQALGHRDSSCSICLNTFLASLAEEEIALVMDSPAQPPELLGVTRLVDTCGHIFCRKELSVDPFTLHTSFNLDPCSEFILSALSRLAYRAICGQGGRGRLGSEEPHPRSLPPRKSDPERRRVEVCRPGVVQLG